MKRKSKLVIVTFVCIVLIVTVVSIYELKTDKYIIQKSTSSVIINGRAYKPADPKWTYGSLNKRVGYIKSDNVFPSLFYIPFEHGVYSLKDDPNNLFYQFTKINASRDYALFVRDDIKLEIPIATDVVYMKNDSGKIIKDKKTIEDFFELFYSTEENEIKLPYEIQYISVYIKDQPSIYYRIIVCRDMNNEWYIEKHLHGYTVHKKLPKELADALIGD